MPTSRSAPRPATSAGTVRRKPGQRAGLDRQAVIEAARAVYDDRGIEGLTMRELAGRLGVAPNAIYAHFPDKTALMDAFLDHLMAGVPLPEPAAEWRRGLVELMAATRALLVAHAELIPLFLVRPARGPNAIRLGEATLALLAQDGLEGASAVEALRILLIYTFGFAAQEAPRWGDPEAVDRVAKSETAFREAGQDRVRAHARDLARHPDATTFATGLGWLLDGIASWRQGGRAGEPESPAG